MIRKRRPGNSWARGGFGGPWIAGSADAGEGREERRALSRRERADREVRGRERPARGPRAVHLRVRRQAVPGDREVARRRAREGVRRGGEGGPRRRGR